MPQSSSRRKSRARASSAEGRAPSAPQQEAARQRREQRTHARLTEEPGNRPRRRDTQQRQPGAGSQADPERRRAVDVGQVATLDDR
jgi:hypothetical protein